MAHYFTDTSGWHYGRIKERIRLKNHNYKLLVLDIDGTLLNRRGNISDEDKQAVARARNSGIRVSLSTGRSTKACLSIIEQLSLDGYHVSFDGALVGNPHQNEEVYAQPISRRVVHEMVDFAHSLEVNLELYSATDYFAERETWSTRAHRDFFALEPNIANFAGIWGRERIIKAALVATNPQEETLIARFRHHLGNRTHFSKARTPAYPDAVFNNILAPKVSKGRALEALAQHLGIPLTEVMAVGDGTNDIALLSAAGLSVAMGSAPEEVKAVANHVTSDVDHSGLAAALDKFLP